LPHRLWSARLVFITHGIPRDSFTRLFDAVVAVGGG
jgi:hypothetical protein